MDKHRIEARKIDKKPIDFRVKKEASIIDVTAIITALKLGITQHGFVIILMKNMKITNLTYSMLNLNKNMV